MAAKCVTCGSVVGANGFSPSLGGCYILNGVRLVFACTTCERRINDEARGHDMVGHPTLPYYVYDGHVFVMRGNGTDIPFYYEVIGYISDAGYVTLSYRKKFYAAHRVIFEAVNQCLIRSGRRIVVMHADDDRVNNHIENLSVGTQSENIHQSFVKGHRQPVHAPRKLTVTIDYRDGGELVMEVYRSCGALERVTGTRRATILNKCKQGGGVIRNAMADYTYKFAV